MSGVLAMGYGGLLTGLKSLQTQEWIWPSPDAGFAAWLFSSLNELHPKRTETLAFTGSDELSAGRAPSVASAGYVLASNPRSAQALLTAWRSGLDRLSRADLFPRDRQSFMYRPVELLGVALGIASDQTAREAHGDWLIDGIKRLVEEDRAPGEWARLLRAWGLSRLEPASRIPLSEHLRELPLECLALTSLLPAVAAANLAKGVELKELRALRTAFLQRAAQEDARPQDLARGATLFLATKHAVNDLVESEASTTWQTDRATKDTVGVVTSLCRRFHELALALQRRQRGRPAIKIEDEYDVQDLLHGLLRLHFTDVRPEEVTPSYGGASGRMDFLLKKERVVVEAKMTRQGLGQRQVRDQLIQDKEMYRVHPDCDTLICFVYDPERHCPNPAALETDLSGQVNGRSTVVIVSPQG